MRTAVAFCSAYLPHPYTPPASPTLGEADLDLTPPLHSSCFCFFLSTAVGLLLSADKDLLPAFSAILGDRLKVKTDLSNTKLVAGEAAEFGVSAPCCGWCVVVVGVCS